MNILLLISESYGYDLCWGRCVVRIVFRCTCLGMSFLVATFVGQFIPTGTTSFIQSLILLVSALLIGDSSDFLKRLVLVQLAFAFVATIVLHMTFLRGRHCIQDSATTKQVNQWLGYFDTLHTFFVLSPLLLVPLIWS